MEVAARSADTQPTAHLVPVFAEECPHKIAAGTQQLLGQVVYLGKQFRLEALHGFTDRGDIPHRRRSRLDLMESEIRRRWAIFRPNIPEIGLCQNVRLAAQEPFSCEPEHPVGWTTENGIRNVTGGRSWFRAVTQASSMQHHKLRVR